MKKNLMKGVITASVSLLAFGVAASNVFEQYDLVPYAGIDAQWRHMDFKKGTGKNQSKTNYPQGNVYLGLKLNQYLGFEIGHEHAKTVKKDSSALGSDTVFNEVLFPFAPNAVSTFNTKTKLRAFHANVVGFLPISEEYRLQLIGSLGVAHVNVNTVVNPFITINGVPTPPHILDQIQQVFSKKKWVPKIGVGLQHMLTSELGVRAMANWEGTWMTLKPLNTTSAFTTVRTKNSVILGLGLFYNFR